MSSVTTLQSAQPVDSTTSVSGNAFTGALVTGSLNGLGGGFSRVPFQPVDNLDVDQVYRVDAPPDQEVAFHGADHGATCSLRRSTFFNTPYDTARTNAEYTFTSCTASSSASACPAGNKAQRWFYRSSYGAPNSTAASPDGTQARRAQVSLRVTF